MAYAAADGLAAEAIPVVDLAPLRDGSDPGAVATALSAASTGLGFIYVNGHGIPDRVLDDARTAAFRFFRSPAARKAEVAVSSRHRGWLAQGGARMQDEARPDLKESFVWGDQGDDGEAPLDHPLCGPNRWPGFVPELEGHAMAFFRHAHGLARHLLRGFAIGLGVEEGCFLRGMARPLSRGSFVYYPAQPEELGEERFGVGPHTDFGVLTILSQDLVGGLQVQDAGGRWLQAPPIAGTLVINVGDLLARWTDGAYTSTPHRVVNSSGRERLSLVLAYDPDPDTVIDAREVFGPGHRPRHDPIACGDYLVRRFARAFSYRQG